MTAHELLTALLKALPKAVAGVDFQEAYSPYAAPRRRERPLVTGRVEKESLAGEDWSAALGFTVYLPGGEAPGRGLEIVRAMAGAVKESQPLLVQVQTGPPGPEKALGGLAVSCVFHFAAGNGGASAGKARYRVSVNGQEYTAAGWKESVGGRETAYTAIGETQPFYRKQDQEFTIELQGLSAGLAGLEDFTLKLGEGPWIYSGCRWKSMTAAGTGVAVAQSREKAQDSGKGAGDGESGTGGGTEQGD